MASGYTECVMTGEVTDLREFIARSFNNNAEDPVVVKHDGKWMYRKQLLDISFPEGQLAKEKEQLDWLEKADELQLADAANKAWLQACQNVHERTEHDQEKIVIRSRYEAMVEKLKEWQKNLPHEKLLAFSRGLLRQLQQSIDFDCGKRVANPEQPVLATPAEYKTNEIGNCRHMIQHYENSIAERKRENDERNEVYNSLCRYLNGGEEGDYSLPLTEPTP